MNNYIDIDISDNSQFTHIALLIDSNENLQKDILRLRNKWSKDKNIKSVGKQNQFTSDLLSLLEKYNLSVAYYSVLKQAILSDKITSFERVQSIAVPQSELKDLYLLSDDTITQGNYELLLIAPLEANADEVAKTFTKMKQKVKKLSKETPQDIELPKLSPETLSNIGRDRKWYWQHQSKEKGGEEKSYLKIAEEFLGNNKDKAWQYKDTVRKAIKQYGRLLEVIRNGNLTTS